MNSVPSFGVHLCHTSGLKGLGPPAPAHTEFSGKHNDFSECDERPGYCHIRCTDGDCVCHL